MQFATPSDSAKGLEASGDAKSDTIKELEMTPEELVQKIVRFKPYFHRSGGGVTFSGGDPLKQPEFLKETLKLCKEAGIHTTLDTAGVDKRMQSRSKYGTKKPKVKK